LSNLVVYSAAVTVSGSFQRGWSQREKKTTDLPVSWTAYRKTVFLQTSVTDGNDYFS